MAYGARVLHALAEDRIMPRVGWPPFVALHSGEAASSSA
jgi:hypothetical protein